MDEASRARNELLRRAHGVIVEYGWVQGGYGDLRTGFCVVGALDEARREMRLRCRFDFDPESIEEGFHSSYDALRDLVWLEGFWSAADVGVLSRWNDEPGRTRTEVLDLFSQAFVPGS